MFFLLCFIVCETKAFNNPDHEQIIFLKYLIWLDPFLGHVIVYSKSKFPIPCFAARINGNGVNFGASLYVIFLYHLVHFFCTFNLKKKKNRNCLTLNRSIVKYNKKSDWGTKKQHLTSFSACLQQCTYSYVIRVNGLRFTCHFC